MFKQKLVHCCTALALVAAPLLLSVPMSGWAQIEEIVVTARRREESLQEVPLAVEVFSRDAILRKGINSVDQLALLSASLGYESATSPEAQKLSIRGISPTRGRQNLAILVDGIDVTTESITQNGGGAALQTRFMDIERIELVKGPQSALYGRSAFNGALQYVSMDPSDEFGVDFNLEGGEFDRYSLRTSISGPMGDRWGYRINAAMWDEEGFYENSRTQATVGGAEGFGGAVTLKWEPTEKFSLKWRGAWSDQDREPNATVLVPANVATYAPGDSCIDQFPDDPANPNTIGIQSVFECVGFESDVNKGGHVTYGSKDLVAGTNTTIAQWIEGFANPNGTPLVAGPIVEGVNEPISFYMGSVQSQTLRAQYRGVLPDPDDIGPIAIDPDPRTGRDWPGSNIKEFRTSLMSEYATDSYTISTWTGYMDGETHGIQDWQAAGDWDMLCGTWIDPNTGAPFPDQSAVDPAASCVLGHNDNRHEIQQFSQEIRFASNWKGWQQMTVGGNYWDETRKFYNQGGTVRARSFDCVFDSRTSGGEVMTFSDGSPICGVFSIPIDAGIMNDVVAARKLVYDGALDVMNGIRKTEHYSAYFMLETDLDQLWGGSGDRNNWSLRFEGRWNQETTWMRGQDSSASGSTGAGVCGDGPIIASMGAQNNYFGPDAGPATKASNACSMKWLPGWFVIPQVYSGTGGPPNLPYDGPIGFDTPPCGYVDLSTIQDEEAMVQNCKPAAALIEKCRDNLVAQNLTENKYQVTDGPGGAALDCFRTWQSGETDESWFTPKVAIEYQPTDDYLFYFSWARGEKPAGFNTIPFGSTGFNPNDDEYKAEIMDVWELGYKTAWLDNTLLINGAFFFQDYSDKQVNTQRIVPDPVNVGNFNTSPMTINASSAEAPGMEIDIFWAPITEVYGGNVGLNLSYTYLDAKYTDFAMETTGGTDVYVVNSCVAAPKWTPGGAGQPDVPVPQCITQRGGNHLEDAPQNSLILGGRYEHPFPYFGGDSTWFFEFDTVYRDKAFLEDANAVQVDEWWNTDIRLGWQTEQYEAVFFVNNVFDDDTFQRAYTTPGLASSFYFAHTRDTPIPAVAGPGGRSIRSIGRNGPEFNSGVVGATVRPPRHWGFRFALKFGG